MMEQKLITARMSTRQFLRAWASVKWCFFSSIAAFSAASRLTSQPLSGSVSHRASSGRSVRTNRQATPRNTAGIASRINSHCQPFSPMPSSVISIPEIGEPKMLAIGMPSRNSDVARARAAAGNHMVR